MSEWESCPMYRKCDEVDEKYLTKEISDERWKQSRQAIQELGHQKDAMNVMTTHMQHLTEKLAAHMEWEEGHQKDTRNAVDDLIAHSKKNHSKIEAMEDAKAIEDAVRSERERIQGKKQSFKEKLLAGVATGLIVAASIAGWNMFVTLAEVAKESREVNKVIVGE